jgi:hypothetical protein
MLVLKGVGRISERGVVLRIDYQALLQIAIQFQ